MENANTWQAKHWGIEVTPIIRNPMALNDDALGENPEPTPRNMNEDCHLNMEGIGSL